ncbi:MAG: AAA family ATPase [Thermosphaera sp.]
MKLILVVGMPGAGKTMVIDVAKRLGIKVYNMGDIVREEALKRFNEITPKTMIETSIILRREYGSKIIALKTIERIDKSLDIVVIDGVRSLEELEEFKKLGDTIIVAVHASPRTRFQRILERRRPGDPISYEDFTLRDLVELGFGVGNLIALADFMIVNESTVEELEKVSLEIFGRLVKKDG